MGICRGFQAIFKWLGGEIKRQNNNFSDFHVATRHQIVINKEIKEVNSYHSNALVESSKPDELEIIARCKRDDSIEAFKGRSILGLMWHPEREKKFNEWDAKKIKKLFNY